MGPDLKQLKIDRAPEANGTIKISGPGHSSFSVCIKVSCVFKNFAVQLQTANAYKSFFQQ